MGACMWCVGAYGCDMRVRACDVRVTWRDGRVRGMFGGWLSFIPVGLSARLLRVTSGAYMRARLALWVRE